MKILYSGIPYLNLNPADIQGPTTIGQILFAKHAFRHSHNVVSRTKAIFCHIAPKLEK